MQRRTCSASNVQSLERPWRSRVREACQAGGWSEDGWLAFITPPTLSLLAQHLSRLRPLLLHHPSFTLPHHLRPSSELNAPTLKTRPPAALSSTERCEERDAMVAAAPAAHPRSQPPPPTRPILTLPIPPPRRRSADAVTSQSFTASPSAFSS
ncbi:unnamed protein product [Cutaneotrichosporon oleaginosum]